MPSLLPDLFSEAEWLGLRNHFRLSERQLQVARWICRGCTNDAIAARLRLSEGTVRVYTDGLYKRMGVQSRLGLLVRIVEATRSSRGEHPRRAP